MVLMGHESEGFKPHLGFDVTIPEEMRVPEEVDNWGDPGEF